MTILKKLSYLFIFFTLSACNACSDSNNDSDNSSKNSSEVPAGKYSAVFGGGPFYSGGMEVMEDLKSSGFSTVIIWTIHIGADASMNFNDTPIINAEGEYIGDPEWKTRLATLTTEPTSVDRIELGVGAWGAQSWENIKNLIATEGIGPDTKLYKAFQKLQDITGASAINYDDEVTFDVPSTVEFSLMLADMGYKVALCPFNEDEYWKAVYEQVEAKQAGTVDRVYLQCYAGGWKNKPSQWNQYFGDLKVSYGLWCRNGENCSNGDKPAIIQEKISNEKENIDGGFIWLYDDIQKCAAYGKSSSYAKAINDGLE
ncbi:lysyl endopeptidase [Marinifilum sp. N1E240]|uniref:lysyl endopeptidase n=1 Tax=Marinifilum sp. N1E240 TaxID=2608082 RepID=UPI00128BFE40|nr:lysyl endopeptidase [Marinifilum sp. N1E240]MPQ46109.1 lysyl endopeptidase [Marinifilum sp. N1E240]